MATRTRRREREFVLPEASRGKNVSERQLLSIAQRVGIDIAAVLADPLKEKGIKVPKTMGEASDLIGTLKS